MPSATGPIADLSYRTYDGPLDPPTHRWKVIAKATAMRVARNKWFWYVAFFSGWYYIVMGIFLFGLDMLKQAGGNQGTDAFNQLLALDWPGQFLHGFSFGQLGFMLIALMAGAGAIANDNRSNALLVYLSKPCTKKDYLIGKWVGVFVPLLAAMAIPAVAFYIFGALNYRDFGFITQDAWIPLRMAAIISLSAAFYASLVLGVSSMFNQGRLAGATYAGIYVISNFVTRVMWIILVEADDAPAALRSLAEKLYYFSIDGLCIGIAKVFLDLDSAPMFMIPESEFTIDRPIPLLAFTAMFGLAALALSVAWKRIRAVEIVN